MKTKRISTLSPLILIAAVLSLVWLLGGMGEAARGQEVNQERTTMLTLPTRSPQSELQTLAPKSATPRGTQTPEPTQANINYMELIIGHLVKGDVTEAQRVNELRNQKIDDFHLDTRKIVIEDLYLLAKVIWSEAGSSWLCDEWKMSVGEVVLNRVASPEFPNTIPDVIYQPGQYSGADNSWFANVKPSERCLYIALNLLEGQRYLNNSLVVFQAQFKQGSGVHTKFYDKYYGYTYFCYTSYPELYAEEGN